MSCRFSVTGLAVVCLFFFAYLDFEIIDWVFSSLGIFYAYILIRSEVLNVGCKTVVGSSNMTADMNKDVFVIYLNFDLKWHERPPHDHGGESSVIYQLPAEECVKCSSRTMPMPVLGVGIVSRPPNSSLLVPVSSCIVAYFWFWSYVMWTGICLYYTNTILMTLY